MQSLTQLVDEFIDHLNKSGKSSLTIVAYKNDLSQLISFLATHAKTNAGEVTSADLEVWKQELSSKNYTAKSVARKLNAIKGLFRWARDAGKVQTDPASSVAHPKYELAAPRVLSPIEYRALRDSAREDIRIAAIVELLLQTGMRISEVAALKLADLKDTTVIITGREIPLNPPAKRAVDLYLEKRPLVRKNSGPEGLKIESDHLFNSGESNLFITKTGRPLLVRNIRAAIERSFAEAGIENATVNDIRNTFIVYQLSRGVDLLTVSRMVGHKRLATTERYLELAKVATTAKRNGISEL